MTVFWFDAHADLNTPGTSPSGHFHGMVLRALIGHEAFNFSPNHPLSPKQVVLLGLRDLDPAEQDYIEAERIRLIPPTQVAEVCWLAGLPRTSERRPHANAAEIGRAHV